MYENNSEAPKIIRWLIWLTRRANIVRYWRIIIIAGLVVSFTWLRNKIIEFRIPSIVESSIVTENQEYWDRYNPPLPVNINGSIVYDDYLNHNKTKEPYSLYFFTGPAGAGKSIIRKKLIRELHEKSKEAIVVRLNKLGDIKQPQTRLGNDAKFSDLSKFFKDCSGLRNWISKYLIQKIDDPSKMDAVNAYVKKLKNMTLILDDFDEINFNSRKKILDDVYDELKNQKLESLSIFILTRAEAILDVSGINELNEYSKSSDNFEIKVYSISGFRKEMNNKLYEEYFKNAIKWGGNAKYNLVNERLRSKTHIPDSIISDFSKWIDGANIVAKFFSSQSEFTDNTPIFMDYFKAAWRSRAAKTHQFPDYEFLNSYCTISEKLISQIPVNNGTTYNPKFKPLFYSGLIEIEPVTSALGSSRIRRQFSLIDSFCQ